MASRRRQQDEALVTALVGVLGARIGALTAGIVGYYVSSAVEAGKQRQQIQLDAYADFIKAQANWQRVAGGTEQGKAEAELKIRDPAFRIIVFSPANVVKTLVDFMADTTKVGVCTGAKSGFVMYQSIRRQVSQDDAFRITDSDIAMGLYGCALK